MSNISKELLELQLIKIKEILKKKYMGEEQIGVLSGLSGISLFHFYYDKYFGTLNKEELGTDVISECINKINKGYSYPTYCSGLAGVGWVLNHLEEKKIIHFKCDDILPPIDDFLYSVMISDMRKNNYDFLHGAIGYALYFLSRYKNTESIMLKIKYKAILLEFIDLLYNMAEKVSKNQFRWLSILNRETYEVGYNLSLSHGMSSIIGVLTKLNEYKDFKIHTEEMLKGAINYILSFKNKNDCANFLFPSWIKEDEDINYKSRLAWCYGDLGIGVRLWYASKVLNDEVLSKTAIRILKNATKLKSPSQTMVIDVGICHGSYGNAQIFYRMFKETNDPIFKEASEFWIQEGLNRGIHLDGYVGYKQWCSMSGKWEERTSLLEGVAGIGLTLISYLSDFDLKWDECLMIS